MVAFDLFHVEQRAVEIDRGVEVVNDEADMVDASDRHAQAASRSRTWTMLPLGSRR